MPRSSFPVSRGTSRRQRHMAQSYVRKSIFQGRIHEKSFDRLQRTIATSSRPDPRIRATGTRSPRTEKPGLGRRGHRHGTFMRSFRARPWPNDDPAPRTVGAGELPVQRRERTAEVLGGRHVPSVATGQVAPQRPSTLRKRREGERSHVQPQRSSVRARGLEPRNLAGPFQPARHVGDLDQNRFWTGCIIARNHRFRPTPVAPRIDECRHQNGRVDNDRHRRSASRACRMVAGETRVSAASFRSRARCNRSSTEGWEAMRSSSPRRNPCMDWPCRAARRASLSLTSSGTPRMVIRTAMTASCPHRRRKAIDAEPVPVRPTRPANRSGTGQCQARPPEHREASRVAANACRSAVRTERPAARRKRRGGADGTHGLTRRGPRAGATAREPEAPRCRSS